MKTEYCYLNGKILPISKAHISLTDIALLRGYGLFDSMRGDGNKIFHGQDHIKRFFNSAKILDLKPPVDAKKLEQIIITLLKKNKFKHSKIRVVLTGGELLNSLDYNKNKPNLFILAQDLKKYPKSIYQKGVKLITVDYQRPYPFAKSNNYLVAVREQADALRQNAFEILYKSNGKLYECSISNFFIIKGSTLITAEKGVLPGVTRKIAIELAKTKLKLKTVKRDMLYSELKTADEAFICASYKGIVPVVKIDTIKIGNSKPGPITSKLSNLYDQLKA